MINNRDPDFFTPNKKVNNTDSLPPSRKILFLKI